MSIEEIERKRVESPVKSINGTNKSMDNKTNRENHRDNSVILFHLKIHMI